MHVTINHGGLPIARGSLRRGATGLRGDLEPLAGYDSIAEDFATGWGCIGHAGFLGPTADARSIEACDSAIARFFQLATELEVVDEAGVHLPTSQVLLVDRRLENGRVAAIVLFHQAPARTPAGARTPDREDAAHRQLDAAPDDA